MKIYNIRKIEVNDWLWGITRLVGATQGIATNTLHSEKWIKFVLGSTKNE